MLVKRLAIVSTHPIQYNAPWFQLLKERGNVELKIFYTWSQTEQGPKYDPTFQKVVAWDIPLLVGYSYKFVRNISSNPGSHHFRGIDNPTLNEEIERWMPTEVLVIGWSYKSHLACLRHFKGKVPVLFRGDSTLIDEKMGVKKILRRIFLRWVYSYVDIVLYVGSQNKAYFTAHGIREKQLIPAYHAIDNQRFSTSSSARNASRDLLRQLTGIKETDTVVLFAGKFEEKKDPLFLVDLAAKLKDSDIIFLLIGNGPLENTLKEKAAFDKRIKFLPFQNQSLMPAVYSLATLFILPSRGPGETWGLAANEAMASGLPILLSSKVGSAMDLVNENGLIFNPGDVETVALYIEKLRQSPDQIRIAGTTSRNYVTKFNFTQLAEGIEKACGI